MKCEECGRCIEVKHKDEKYVVSCTSNGMFEIHEDRLESFRCDEMIEMPPSENVMVVLKCGREFMVYDKEITCDDDIQRRINDAIEKERWVAFDGMYINTTEIGLVMYVR